jgi:pimeloyl-ACP methyl ester carboxylesterase
MTTYVTSRDGTRIAVERIGTGRPLVMLGGALQSRGPLRPYAEALSQHLTVFLYDRRGRGESGDTPPYAVEREVEDLAAVVAEAGGTASVYGHSSGAALVLQAAASGLPVDRIVLHDPPFGSGSEEERRAEQEELQRFEALVAEDRREDVVRLFATSTGMPAEMADALAEDPMMVANAPTILYEYELLSEKGRAGRTPEEQAATVAAPALVVVGGASPPFMADTARRIAGALPDGRLEVLEGQDHVPPQDVVAPVLGRFLAGP